MLHILSWHLRCMRYLHSTHVTKGVQLIYMVLTLLTYNSTYLSYLALIYLALVIYFAHLVLIHFINLALSCFTYLALTRLIYLALIHY